jgi:hypothetical protein
MKSLKSTIAETLAKTGTKHHRPKISESKIDRESFRCCQQLETYGSCNNSKISTIAKYYATKDEKKRTPLDSPPYLEDNAWPSCCASPIFKMLNFPPRRPPVRAQIFIPLQNTCRRWFPLRHRQLPPRSVPISDASDFELASVLPSM